MAKRDLAKVTADLWAYERALIRPVSMAAGVDEAGRGALAGPVVAAAVVLDGDGVCWDGVYDSKQLTRIQRERMSERIWTHATSVSVGIATPEEIDEWNILQASRIAMGRAVAGLSVDPEVVLADGPYPPKYQSDGIPSLPVVNGDAKCLSIAAASIVAKVWRDNDMREASCTYPVYAFSSNVGYPTRAHLEALHTYGPTPIHRMSFAPVQAASQAKLDLAW